jgi:hypothetical protein
MSVCVCVCTCWYVRAIYFPSECRRACPAPSDVLRAGVCVLSISLLSAAVPSRHPPLCYMCVLRCVRACAARVLAACVCVLRDICLGVRVRAVLLCASSRW